MTPVQNLSTAIPTTLDSQQTHTWCILWWSTLVHFGEQGFLLDIDLKQLQLAKNSLLDTFRCKARHHSFWRIV